MIDEPELLLPAPGKAYLVIGVHILGIEDVRRGRREAGAIGSQHAPGLSSQKLELAACQVHPVEAQAHAVAIAGHESIAGLDTQKVRFKVALDVAVADLTGG